MAKADLIIESHKSIKSKCEWQWCGITILVGIIFAGYTYNIKKDIEYKCSADLSDYKQCVIASMKHQEDSINKAIQNNGLYINDSVMSNYFNKKQPKNK